MVSRALQGVFRSLRIYHGPDVPRAAMDALYRRFMEPGDLVFDIGAHVGDRVSSFRRLGARVVAIEPQSLLIDALAHIHGRDPLVVILPRALGARSGRQAFHLNTDNPTVSTISDAFLQRAGQAPGWEEQSWDDEVDVDVVTLDALLARFGIPAFIKIDVEGYEDAVLCGLSHPVKALSFEFTTIMRDTAIACLERLSLLGDYRYNFALGETQRLTFESWLSEAEMATHLFSLPHEANSGDVYAVLATEI
ncbi:FkbM family methyltransferase [Hyphomicrobium denitrificans 1NES1]|uniref:FkbM family methyltransferase n=1 Tax=Hyphomicrobium denitrificans 1NES1 TaxID=670307 RepID=N0B3B8_9HYPH|nr:FkbM family methyltransferase [Hyphomicrobium denitrificans]AGK57994.1 FkbM family methyltransferase [Hyphomicrobium denitrificans 1NES1]